ncbi:peroxiredoxin-like family protein [Paracraurococcus lichenis]|uniref:thioredoxin-dependent peroxiredoxin n=1 Tax=Paracraurococcus lichenis TaxID=3064888 RepID=A0ABT9DZW6_9PROT|nr:peroxiredoxin-like family protein [Paracraurococcus sp. LOR1-02]MDO9709453.1 peroxiredoxin-like family protein [Paracraurococcus sp. LOR1-02]
MLQQELDAFAAEWRKKAPAEAQALIAAQIEDLKAEGIEARALGAGAEVPDITLPDVHGRPVRLRDLGPAVFVFYRGGWCPYCNLQLRAWQRELAAMEAAGVRLVAISPQTPDESLSTLEKNSLAFPVLSDSEGLAARAFGILFDLPPDLVALYTRFGHDLPRINGQVGWSLPIPGTFVAGAEGRLVFGRAEADYRNRVEPAEALAALASRRVA